MVQGYKESIVLFGYGKHGKQIASYLRRKNYRLTIVESDERQIAVARVEGFEDVRLVDVTDDEALLGLDLGDSYKTAFCAMEDDGLNLFLVISLRALWGNLNIVAVCESKEVGQKLRLAGADNVIDAFEATGNKIFRILEKPAVTEVLENIIFGDININIAQIKIPRGSILQDRLLEELDFKRRYNLILVGVLDREMGEEFIFATKGTSHKLDAGDVLVLIGEDEYLKKFENDLMRKAK